MINSFALKKTICFKCCFIFMLIVFSSSCFAKPLKQEERIYYDNLKQCTQTIGKNFFIYGYVNGKCKVSVKIDVPYQSEYLKTVYVYEYPKKELKKLVEDAINMSEDDFIKKWSIKDKQYCTSIKYNGEEILSK